MDEKEAIKRAREFMSKQPVDNELSLQFLQCAKKDLKAGNILYAKGIYDLAVFHLQQAVEKTVKAYLLHLGLITRKELRKTGHHTLKLLITTLFKNEGFLNTLKPIESKIIEPIEKTKKFALNPELYEPNKYLRIDEMNILIMLSAADGFLSDYAFSTVKISNKLIRETRILSGKSLEEAKKITPEDRKMKKMIKRYSLANIKAIILAMITFPHQSATRYPDDPEIKPEDYNQDLGVVATFKELSKETRCVIESYERMFTIQHHT